MIYQQKQGQTASCYCPFNHIGLQPLKLSLSLEARKAIP
jgi:hypothetical protein